MFAGHQMQYQVGRVNNTNSLNTKASRCSYERDEKQKEAGGDGSKVRRRTCWKMLQLTIQTLLFNNS